MKLVECHCTSQRSPMRSILFILSILLNTTILPILLNTTVLPIL